MQVYYLFLQIQFICRLSLTSQEEPCQLKSNVKFTWHNYDEIPDYWTTVILLLEHCWVFLMHLVLLITKMTSKLFHHIPFLINRHFEFLSPIFNNDRLLIL